MKYSIFLISVVFLLNCNVNSETQSKQQFITSDITNFWTAYDSIISTKDSVQQLVYLQNLFIEKASKGQKKMFELRRYRPEEYVQAINDYPQFWESIRENTLKANTYGKEISRGIKQFQTLYPRMKSAKIYFTMGVFRSPGTTLDDMVLIGSEFALGDTNTVTIEMPERLNYVKAYFKNDPIREITFLNVHEYIHTQQTTGGGLPLVSQCLREGVAEFIATLAVDIESSSTAISYGNKNREAVYQAFLESAFSRDYSNWLWSSKENEFGQRDLGYFIGYEIAKNYYANSENKTDAIRELIEVEYRNEDEVCALVDRSKCFRQSMKKTKAEFSKSTPKVASIAPPVNNNQNVNSSIDTITVFFSQPMNINSRGFDFGPLGESNLLKVEDYLGFSDDRKSVSWIVKMDRNKRYQIELTGNFTDYRGRSLEPYLIDFRTK